jgi:hypothetical protein
MTAKIHRVHIPGVGESMVEQGSGFPYTAGSLVKPAGFEVGDILRLGSKTFVLAKTGGAVISVGLGVKNGLCQGIANSAVAAAALAGATQVILTTSATSGALGTGAIAEDEFAGGEIVLFSAGVDTPQRRGIVGNTARIATGSLPVTFTLDSPLTHALTTSDTGEAMQSPWSYVVQDTAIGNPVVGVLVAKATAPSMYVWVQTWGPCFASPQAAVGIAGATGLYWRHDGSLDVENADAYVSDQYAGFVLAESSTHTQAAPFFMLQILP